MKGQGTTQIRVRRDVTTKRIVICVEGKTDKANEADVNKGESE